MPYVYEFPAGVVVQQMAAMDERVNQFSDVVFTAIEGLQGIGRFLPGDTPPPAITIPDVTLPPRAQLNTPDVTLLGEIDPFVMPNYETLSFDEGITWGTAPTFTPSITSFEVPRPPAPIQVSDAPTAPTLAEIVIPERPMLPNVPEPTLIEITIPQVAFPTLPTLEAGEDPQYQGPMPSAGFSYTEPTYTATLQADITAQIRRWMAGGTGMHPAVEVALFERGRAREDTAARKAIDDTHAAIAARGYELPPGVLVDAVAQVIERNQLASQVLSREIYIKSAEWEQENLRNAVSQGIACETMLIGLFNAAASRALEAAVQRSAAEVALVNVYIALFNSKQAARSVKVQIFEAQLRAALAPLEALKLYIEAEALKGTVNEQLIRQYSARLDAIKNLVEIYRADISAAQANAEIERTKADIYRTEVQAWAERIGARKVEFDAYEAQTRAAAARAGMYDSESRAFAATVDAFGTTENIKLGRIGARRDALLASVQKFDSATRAESDRVRAEVSEIQAKAEGFRADLGRYSAELQADSTERNLRVQVIEARLRNVIAGIEIASRQYTDRQSRLLAQAQILSEALKAAGAMGAQLSAGAMSAMHVQASLSGNGSASGSSSNSYSETHSYNHEA
jgi:hypothetical protein